MSVRAPLLLGTFATNSIPLRMYISPYAAHHRDRLCFQEHRDSRENGQVATMGHCGTVALQESHPQLSERCSHGAGRVRLIKYALKNIDMGSAEVIPKWIDFIREAGKAEIKIYVVGNKCDLEAEIVN